MARLRKTKAYLGLGARHSRFKRALSARRTTVLGLAFVLVASLLGWVVTDPQALAASSPGEISGTVVGPGNTPLAGICVDVLQGTTEFGSATTDGSGNYTSSIPPGTYTVRFQAAHCNGANYLTQWYNNKPDQTTADPVTVQSGAATTGIDATMVPGATIAGLVTDSTGGLLTNICVSATHQNGGSPDASVQSGANGQYVLQGLASGTYRLFFSDCSGGDHLSQWYQNAPDFNSALPLTVSAGTNTTGIDAQLADGGSISGTVTDTAAAPLTDICVNSFVGNGQSVSGFAQTNATGQYTIHAVPPGPIDVEFSDCSGGDHLTQWYNDKPDQTSADPVIVSAGTNTANVNAALATGGSITGTVTDASNTPASSVCVTAWTGTHTSVGTAFSNAAGVYDLHALTPGTYRLDFNDCGRGDLLDQWYANETSFSTATPIAVTAGAPTTGIDQQLLEGGSISGTVTDTAGNPLAGICVSALTSSSASGTTPTDAAGHFVIHALAPSTQYTVLFSDCSGTDYVSQTYNNKTFLPADPVTVTVGADTPNINASMVLGGSVSGRVTDAGGSPLSGICVDSYDGQIFDGVATTDASGDYTVHALPPGSGQILFVDCSGGDHVSQYYDDKAVATASPDPVPVSAGSNTPNINAQLANGGSISGTIVDQSGAAAVGVCAQAYFASTNQVYDASAGCAGPNGSYTLHGEPGGAFKVAFVSQASGDVLQWYNNQADVGSADVVNVSPGVDTSGINGQVGSVTVGGSAPGAPTGVQAVAGDQKATITWQAPVLTGSSAISEYDVTAIPGGATVRVGGATLSAAFNGLTNGTTYTFTIHAVNGTGAGAESSPSNAIIPVGPSITTLTSSANPSVWGQQTTLTANVMSASGAPGVPSGTVTFDDGTTALGTVPISGSGSAQIVVGTLAVGGHAITATYSGDAAFIPGVSGAINQVVNKAQTITTLSTSANPSVYGQDTLQASVQSLAPGSGLPSGSVVFVDSVDGVIGGGQLDGSGHASLSGISLPAGSHQIVAQYSGDSDFNISSSSSLSQTVLMANTTATVTVSTNSTTSSTPVTLTAQVVSQYAGFCTGTVEFFDGAVSLLTAPLQPTDGVANLTTTLAAGDYQVTARYDGDSNCFPSASKPPPLVVTVGSANGGGGSYPNKSPGGIPGSGVPAGVVVPYTTIHSSGPLTDITITAQLGCSIRHVGDQFAAFYDGVGGCATFISSNGALYGPDYLPNNPSHASYTMVSQTGVSGTGTSASPYRIVTVVDAGSQLQITETDSYIVGDEFYTTDVVAKNLTTGTVGANIGRTGDCYVSDWDSGYGYVNANSGAVGCREAVVDHTTGATPPGNRVLVWSPAGKNSTYFEGSSQGGFAVGGTLTNSCSCNTYLDNAAGLGWAITIPASGNQQLSETIGFQQIALPALGGPEFVSPSPPAGAVLSATPGSVITFTVAAKESASNSTISLTLSGLPAGATFVANPGNPARGTFKWTPNALGSSTVTVTVTDQNGFAAKRTYQIQVGTTYVALGDSFSSGEGDPPFDPSTDIAGVDTCHRSKAYAYPDLLNAFLGTSNSLGFVACSGATTGNVWDSGNKPEAFSDDPEGLQISALTRDTNFVTITIGGDDIDFPFVIEQCVLTSCHLAEIFSEAVRTVDQRIGALQTTLIETYQKIKRVSPNATVFVLGYPYIFPPHPSASTASGCFGGQLIQSDLKWLAPKEIHLNNVIHAAAAKAGVQFVDPNTPGKDYSFLGHDICSTSSWFNTLQSLHFLTYSFHPNRTGQAMMAKALEENGFGS